MCALGAGYTPSQTFRGLVSATPGNLLANVLKLTQLSRYLRRSRPDDELPAHKKENLSVDTHPYSNRSPSYFQPLLMNSLRVGTQCR